MKTKMKTLSGVQQVAADYRTSLWLTGRCRDGGAVYLCDTDSVVRAWLRTTAPSADMNANLCAALRRWSGWRAERRRGDATAWTPPHLEETADRGSDLSDNFLSGTTQQRHRLLVYFSSYSGCQTFKKKTVTEELNPWTCDCIHPCFYDYINELQVKSLPPVNKLLTKKLCLWSELNVCVNWFTFNAVLLNKRRVINIFFKLFTSEMFLILIKLNVKQNTFFSVVSWHDARVHSKINLRWELYFTQHGSSNSHENSFLTSD